MKGQAIVFESVGKAELRDYEVPEPGPGDVLAEMIISGVSVGTERWAYVGKRPEIKFPNVPGYMGLAKITRVGADAKARGYAEGQVINFGRSKLPEPYESNSWMGAHVSHAVVDVCVPAWEPDGFNPMRVETMPAGLDPEEAVLTQLCGVALRGIEMAGIPAGSKVLVCGLGVIGLYAVQACRLKGALVAGTDVVASRVALAKKYRANWAINGKTEDLAARSAEIAPGGYDIVIDTSSVAAVVNSLFPLIKLWGKFVFQGWYPPPSPLDLHALHMRLATCYAPCAHTGRAVSAAMRWAADGVLSSRDMITHREKPTNAQAIYDMLARGSEESLAVIFDWRNL